MKNGRVVHATVAGRLIVNDIDLSIRAVLDGLGLAYLLRDYIAADITAGRLVPVLEDWTPSMSGFFLYHSNRRRITAPLEAFIAFVKDEAKRRGVTSSAPPHVGVRRSVVGAFSHTVRSHGARI